MQCYLQVSGANTLQRIREKDYIFVCGRKIYNQIPTAFLFHEYEEIYDILENIYSMNNKEKLDRVMTTIEFISNGNYMQKAVNNILSYKVEK